MRKVGRLVEGSINPTRTAAGNFATGYRSKRFGRPGKPAGSVRVQTVGRYWGVFDYDPQDGVSYITRAEGLRWVNRQISRKRRR